MKAGFAILAAGAAALAACSTPTGTAGPALPQSAGTAGPGYCETVPPADPAARERWEELCFPGPR